MDTFRVSNKDQAIRKYIYDQEALTILNQIRTGWDLSKVQVPKDLNDEKIEEILKWKNEYVTKFLQKKEREQDDYQVLQAEIYDNIYLKFQIKEDEFQAGFNQAIKQNYQKFEQLIQKENEQRSIIISRMGTA